MIREIFVPLLRSRSDDAALDAAMALAKANDGHINALVALEHPLPLVSEFGYVPIDVNQGQLAVDRADAEAQVAKARTRLGREAVSSEVRLIEVLMPWNQDTTALYARYADLSVLGGKDPQQYSQYALTFKSLLLQSGRPLLLMPMDATLTLPLRHVALAWQPTREATRALHDALPLLAKAARIDVLMIDPDVSDGGHGEQPGADIALHLARHGLEVRVVSMPGQGRSDGENLLRHVQEAGADLLVMGGYGHARWREMALGGATHTVLEDTKTPVLFSH